MTLIERLRSPERATEPYQSLGDLCREAAAELAANAAEIGRKDAALEKCFTLACDYSLHEKQARSDIANIARAALNKQESGNV